jgi:hypothetical protein
MNCGQSPCWPGVRILVTGRHRRSATRRILVPSPPREQPSASRPAWPPGRFLSSGPAPPGQFRGQRPARARGVLAPAHHGATRAHRPALAPGLLTPSPQPIQDLRPGPTQRPAAMPPTDGAPVPEPLRQAPPPAPGPGTEKDPINHRTVIVPRCPCHGCAGNNGASHTHPSPDKSWRFSRSPTRNDLHQPHAKIYTTRPRWLVSFARGGPPGSVIISGGLPLWQDFVSWE